MTHKTEFDSIAADYPARHVASTRLSWAAALAALRALERRVTMTPQYSLSGK